MKRPVFYSKHNSFFCFRSTVILIDSFAPLEFLAFVCSFKIEQMLSVDMSTFVHIHCFEKKKAFLLQRIRFIFAKISRVER